MNGPRSGGGPRIAVVGLACRYPDADSPAELWRNVLAGRRAFRRLPDERMRAEDYYSADRTAPDRHYTRTAAVIEGFEFDRVRYRVAGSTFRSTDMTHWLALDTAARALADAGFPDGGGIARRTGIPDANVGAVVGNSLTGEFSRANLMRLRWPYVRRTVGAALREEGWDDQELARFLGQLEQRYKRPFPAIDEDSLAGGLANTIAGRICNHFDFKGGGYTVDGACSSSLLSVAAAGEALAAGRLDVAVAGGVDLSIDPFEVIGFAKTGALATGEMRVYDRGSNGFWPGEGCGMVVLMRDEDAVRAGMFRYATIAGWGYSSDGRGGITRPEASGHRLALARAYEAAGFGIETVAYFEGHGTGTAVGDATELRAFSEARREAAPDAAPAAIGTVKGNFGHTKAAAGVAGLIKAVLAVRHQVIPPATSHVDTHPELAGDRPALRVPRDAQRWPGGRPVRAGVSSMGFGGINAHVVVEHADGARKSGLGRTARRLARSRQDTELLLVDAPGVAELRGKVAQIAAIGGRLSFAEVGDLAAALQRDLADGPIRAAVVAASPDEVERKFGKLLTLLDNGARSVLDAADGVFLGASSAAGARIGFLFPGQGAGRRSDGGAIRRRFEAVDELYNVRRAYQAPDGIDPAATQVAQPRIVTASLAGLRVLRALGIEAVGAAGHSLGELTALHWAGAMDEDTVLRIAAARGRIMAEAAHGGGTMLGVAAGPEAVEPLLDGEPVVIAGYNGPRQTVVSGPVRAVERVRARAAAQGLDTSAISVSHAFHSAAMAPAAGALRTLLEGERFSSLGSGMVSTVTAAQLAADTDVPALLARQVLDPVRFTEAAAELAGRVDLLLEVGPGRILRGLAAEIAPSVPALALETDGDSLGGLLRAVGAAYTLGAPVRHAALFEDRFTRPIRLDKEFRFFASPAESAPEGDFAVEQSLAAGGVSDVGAGVAASSAAASGVSRASASGSASASVQPTSGDSLEALLRLAAERAELPLSAVHIDSNPVDELHLSSITVGQIVNQACRELGLSAPLTTSAFATSTLGELAKMLDELGATALDGDEDEERAAPGVGPWVRAFAVDRVPAERTRVPVSADSPPNPDGDWRLFAPEHHPLGAGLLEALRRAGLGGGVLLCLPSDCDEQHIGIMLAAAQSALAETTRRFVAVGDRRGAAGLAKTLHLEAPHIATTIVSLPIAEASPDAVDRIVADVAATAGFSEVEYDAAGARTVPVLRALPLTPPESGSALTCADVILVTGGGRGITAECALAVARDSGASVAILGRSDPAADRELAENLERMAAAGVRYQYVRADVTRADEVKAAVDEVRLGLGPVTAVLHGAGRNAPQSLAALDEAAFRGTLAPKIDGLEAVLAAADPASLRLLVTFGSIIGRAGLRGEGDYATANDWLTDLTVRIGQEYPDCRCIAMEWSVWSGAGMGERLGVLESLIREGISPIPVGEGVEMLRRLIADPATPDRVVIMGRAQGLPTLALEQHELPLLRFLERPQVHYAGIELVVDADLSADADPYLADHLLDGDLLFPAVLGMEAMAQAAAALTGRAEAPALEQVEFLRPIVVPVDGTTTIRIAVLAKGTDTVEAVIRSGETGFQADHFRATLRYDGRTADAAGTTLVDRTAPRVAIDPKGDLYASVLFQGRRFQRLRGYHRLAAKGCVAEIGNRATAPWFAGYLPADLVLADPGTRDALMHALQCCVPDATLLPAGIERLELADPAAARGLESVTLHAAERSRDGDTYVYDLDVRDQDGRLVETWRGLRLQAVRKQDGSGPWVPALLGPYLERRTEIVLPRALRVVVHPGAGDSQPARRDQTAEAVRHALGPDAVVRHRPDGRPELEGGGMEISSSHGAGVTFAVAGGRPVACDVEAVVPRSAEEWSGLLGAQGLALARLLAREQGEDLSLAATRVWGAVECLRKNGRAVADLTLPAGANTAPDMTAHGLDRWAALRSGDARLASFPTTLRGIGGPVVFTLLTESGD
ncbi:MAG TPA: type I polyketide synthase [Actinocrinis sp.]|nr:type I polyketide synthase [Actinocrinis sp.]